MITIVDFGMGNIASISNMLKKLGVESQLSSSAKDILCADGLILPGVGAFGQGMANLRNYGLVEILGEAVKVRGKPMLGICLGMQLFARQSEEADGDGLGWLDAEVVRFRLDDPQLRVPHMGWRVVAPAVGSRMFAELPSESRFYFVHSYHVVCHDSADVAARAHYGQDFVAAVEKGNLFGVQFHPEKSHRFGAEILRRFAGQVAC